MRVCICGWYFTEKFLDLLTEITKTYPVTVVANKDRMPSKYKDCFDYHVRENRGLEYGAYDYFLKNVWAGEDVLFMHDDIQIQPIVKDFEIINPLLIFNTISRFKEDVVYIFKSETHMIENCNIHGRVMFMSKGFLKDLKEFNDGFPWDKDNDGHTVGPTPSHCKHYNWAVEELKKFWEVKKITGCEVKSVIIPAIDYQIRGRQN